MEHPPMPSSSVEVAEEATEVSVTVLAEAVSDVTLINSIPDDESIAEKAKDQKKEKLNKIKEDILKDPYSDFPMLRDEATIEWVRKNLVLVVMRGLPGSGKSTLVKHVVDLYTVANDEEPVICSADHYFIGADGKYNFNAANLGQAHKASQDEAQQAIKSGKRMIIVDNTNVVRWEMSAYFGLAEKHPPNIYRVVILEPQTPWFFDPVALAAKNSHGVSEEVLLKRLHAYEVIAPVYFAWFLSATDSQQLLSEASTILQLCFTVEKFWEDFKSFSSMVNVKSAVSYYNRDMCLTGNESIIHCTAKFCGLPKNSGFGKGKGKPSGKKEPKAIPSEGEQFAAKKNVVSSLGQCQDLKIIGFVFTKETFGARVQLTEEQLNIYDQNECDKERGKDKRQYGRPTSSTSSASSTTASANATSTSSLRKVPAEDKNAIFYPIPGRGKRAHITLGTSEGVKPVNTGIDLLEAVNYEKLSELKQLTAETFNVPGSGGQLRRYNKECWVFYPDNHYAVESFFTGHY